MELLIRLGIAFVVFGAAITFATLKIKEVKVTHKAVIPLVAIVFALLNTGLYWLVAFTIKAISLWTLALVAPFLANAVLLYATDRLLKQFEIKGIMPFLKTAGLMTIGHLLVGLVGRFVL